MSIPRIHAQDIVQELTDPARTEPYLLEDTLIEGPVDLRHRIVSIAVIIRRCEFLEEVDIRSTEFKQSVDLSECNFNKPLNSGDLQESHTVFSRNLTLVNAIFRAGASFLGARFLASVNFTGAKFEAPDRELNLAECHFDGLLILDKAVLLGGAKLSNMECRTNAYFQGTRFENENETVDFSSSCFSRSFEGSEILFKGGSAFNSIRCGLSANLVKAKFESSTQEIDFKHASFGLVLDCTEALFQGGASFNAMSGSGAFFHQAKFINKDKTVDLGYVSFRNNLQCRRTEFHGPASFNCAKIEETLILQHAAFHSDVYLSNTKMRRLEIQGCQFASNSLDVRGLSFQTVDDVNGQARSLLTEQKPKFFTRDPYIQMESYFEKIGNDLEAAEVYYQGRCALRKNAKNTGNTIRWTKARNASDVILKWLTGYGVKTSRVLIPIFVFLVAATFIFWSNGALTPTSTTVLQPQNWQQRLVSRTTYSLDLFLPVVDLGICDHWKPATRKHEVYSVVHVLAGWFLVPLLLASGSGLVRKQ